MIPCLLTGLRAGGTLTKVWTSKAATPNVVPLLLMLRLARPVRSEYLVLGTTRLREILTSPSDRPTGYVEAQKYTTIVADVTWNEYSTQIIDRMQ